jgi:hypothetical protein
MFALSKLAIAGLTMGGLLIGGCAANGAGSAAAPSTQAVTCSKCQVTWVKVPDTAKGRVVGYTTRKSMTCPDCKSAVDNFFATGKLQHTCETCGDSMEICERH